METGVGMERNLACEVVEESGDDVEEVVTSLKKVETPLKKVA